MGALILRTLFVLSGFARFGTTIELSKVRDVLSSAAVTTTAPTCHCTTWSEVSAAQLSCTDITLDNINVPANSGLSLTALKPAATVTFVGNTSFEYTPKSGYKMVYISGNNARILGAPGSFFDGGGPLYWDGLGNGGNPKPGNFMKLSLTNFSIFENITVINTPTHAIDLDGAYNSTVQNIVIDNSLGFAPNALSNGSAAAHNTDAFDVAQAENMLLQNVQVWNQDDCVALSVSNNVTFRNFYCSGSHGLSIAGGGTGPGQNMTHSCFFLFRFTDSIVRNGSLGLRIKTDLNSTGSVVNVTYSNIAISNISSQGIDIIQNYYNGGPYGDYASNGVAIHNLTFANITGTTGTGAMDYYIFCGNGSCTDFTFSDVRITGGTLNSSCNYPSTGCPNS
ncbi:glycoside hydrolase [Xylariaceae sp. FL1272]|nr:glycoside hydrolase [Xylariaceae sp. FL1272]